MTGTTKRARLHAGDRVAVAGHLNRFATFLDLIDDAHAWVQFHDGNEVLVPAAVAIAFLTPAEQGATR